MKQQNYIEGNFGTKPQKAIVNTVNRASYEILQADKFRNLRNFATLQNLYSAHSPSIFSSNCLLICTCIFEVSLGSSYLSRFDDNGVIGLQN